MVVTWILPLVRFSLRFAALIGTALAIVLTACIMGQDFLLFPQLWIDAWSYQDRDASTLPPNVESTMLRAADGTRIEIWRLARMPEHPPAGTVLLLHGNGGRVDNFYGYVKWFAERGYTTYAMEYRGYGSSEGWPSAAAIMKDLDTTVDFMARRESKDPSDIIPVGLSLGSGFAAYVGQRYRTKLLLLVSPYTSLRTLAQNKPFLGWFADLLWNEVPSEYFVSRLENTCIVAAHGLKDDVIPAGHSRKLKKIYKGAASFELIEDQNSGHGEIFWNTQSKIHAALKRCAPARQEIRANSTKTDYNP